MLCGMPSAKEVAWVVAGGLIGSALIVTAVTIIQPQSPSTSPSTTQEWGGFLCEDGTISHAESRQGACSYHGGVQR
jgi:hypothetical protein